MNVTLQEIFIAHLKQLIYNRQDSFTLNVNSNLLNIMAAPLNLSYLESDSLEENICFANNNDVRPEFKTVYNNMDIIHYVSPFLTKAALD